MAAIPPDTNATASEVAPLLRDVFGDEPDMNRLDQADLMVIRDTDMTPVAVLAVEKGLDGSWYCWLLAVSEAQRGKGLGSSLLQTVVRRAKEHGAVSVWLKTFQERAGMQKILRRDGWFLCGAELAGRFDGVREIWRLPLISSPMGILVIGANPEGRGGEWVKRIQTMPEMWALRGIVEPSASHRMYWGGIGVPSFSSMDDPGALQHVEAVVLAVPPTQVVALQRDCMNRGLAILVEKPLASSLSELAELQDAVVSNPVPIIVGVQRRSHPSYVALRAAFQYHRPSELSVCLSLGRPVGDQPPGHRSTRSLCRGGALLDLGYHALDLVQFVLGQPLELVSCTLEDSEDLANGIESSARLLGRCGTTWVRIEVDRHGNSRREEVLARTEDGVWRANREQVIRPDGSLLYECKGSWESAECGRLVELAQATATKNSHPVDLWDHLKAFELVERAYAMAHIHGLEGFTA
jgi:predicted dehydrogenase/GNAT superfamily N-acetyltransferase